MSGPIRTVIGATKARLKKYMEEMARSEVQLEPKVDPEMSRNENISCLEETKHHLNFAITRIRNAVELLSKKNDEWSQLIERLPEKEAEAQSELYKTITEEPDSFIITWSKGLEILDVLIARMNETEEAIARLYASAVQTMKPPFSGLPHKETSLEGGESPQGTPVGMRIRLPKLQLPYYYGDSLKWTEFWDAYEAAVHTQEIPQVQKFNYLLCALRGQAYTAIEGIAVTNANYQEAIDILKQRFGNVNVIKRSLYTQLRKLPVSSGKTIDLRHTLEGIDRVCRQLKSLGEDLNHPNLVLTIQEKLPPGILMELGKCKSPDEMWQLDELRGQLDYLVRVREEAIQIVQNVTSDDQRVHARSYIKPEKFKQQLHSSTETFAALTAADSKGSYNGSLKKGTIHPCVFCGEIHFNDQCIKFSTPESRKAQLKELELCFQCLRPGHMTQRCTFTQTCVYCKGSHNRALCLRKKSGSNSFAPIPPTPREAKVASKAMKKENSTATPTNTHTVTEERELQTTDENCTFHMEDKGNSEGNFVMKTSITPQERNQSTHARNEVTLLTAKTRVFNIEVDGEQGKSAIVHLLFDCGSQRSFITQTLAKKLGLKQHEEETLSVYTFASNKPQQIKAYMVQIGIALKDGTEKIIQASAVPMLTNKLQRKAIKNEDWRVCEQILPENLADYLPWKNEIVIPDILIGSDYFWDFIEAKETINCSSGLYLIPSKVGLLLSGKQEIMEERSNDSSMCTVVTTPTELWDMNNKKSYALPINVEEFWNLESIGIKESPDTNDDDIALQQFNENIKFENDRYQVKWPWKSNSPQLPNNYWLCYGRLKSLMKRFSTDNDLLMKYDEIIKDQLRKGIIERVEDGMEVGPIQHYIPHHPVITPLKATTKIRIVYDASARMKKTTNSLNDCLYRGPIMLPDLCGLLMRFRKSPVAVTADIEKAFLQIGLQCADRDVTRFLWVKDLTKPFSDNFFHDIKKTMEMKTPAYNDNIQIYRFCRVTFGVISSPFLLSATLQYHLKKTGNKTALALIENTYVDNVLMGVENAEEAYHLYDEAKTLFTQASMNLREWTSNLKEFREHIREEDRLKDIKTKVLGILWDTAEDTLQLSMSTTSVNVSTVTKREVLHTIASTYDPLGLLSPVMLKGKIFFQNLWREKYGWDDPLSEKLLITWNKIMEDWNQNSHFFVPRHIAPGGKNSKYQLLTFVDASKDAYAAVVYIRLESEHSTRTHLLFSKNRLTPKKGISLPRLELLAVLIGVRITKFVSEQMKLPLEKKIIWSDSECVLHWIQSPKPLSTFVANRIREIRSQEDIYFRYISTHENPADISTRGVKAEGFDNLTLWWYGPEWLKSAPENWPVWNLPELKPSVLKDIDGEIKTAKSFHEAALAVVEVQGEFMPFIDATRYSTWPKLLHVTLYCLRFLKQIIWNKLSNETMMKLKPKLKILSLLENTDTMVAADIKLATRFTLRQLQQQYFPDIFHSLSKLHKAKNQLRDQLGVDMDTEGILRCYGRLTHADIDKHTIYPILLPRKAYITQLIIMDVHKAMLHSGVQHTLSNVRQDFWIPKGRIEVQKAIRHCFICRKYSAGPYSLPKIPPLPKERVTRSKPFQNTGLDYLGPLWIKPYVTSGDRMRAWICLFTCLVTRAIHLEPIIDLSAPTFLNCVRRFIARRGRPDKIISDNAPHFKLTQKTLHIAWLDVWNDPNNISYFAQQKIDWHFITEYAPWQGGFYERLVGLTKQALRKAIGRQCLNFEQFFTLLPEVEAVLNSRPLTFVYDDFTSRQVLRPIDFLLPKSAIGIPPLEENHEDEEYLPRNIDSKQKLLQIWRQSLKSIDKFWELWYGEYLVSLRERVQIIHKRPRIYSDILPQLDEIVLIKEEGTPRGIWKLGRIVELKKGRDNKVRTAKVLLPNKTEINRPINLLYPLEVSEEKNKSNEENIAQRDAHNSLATLEVKDKPKKMNIQKPTCSKPKMTTLYNLATVITLFCFIISGVHGSNMCIKSDQLTKVHSQTCQKTGIIVMETKDGNLCWISKTCPTGHLDENGKCGPICPCPEWADECIHYEEITFQTKEEQTAILNLAKPNICSFKPDPKCSDIPTHTRLHQIQLGDDTLHFVKNLELVRTQPEQDSFECIGEGPPVGTEEFCTNHDCAAIGSKFCFYRNKEIVFFTNEDGKIPIKAWGTVPRIVYGPREKLAENPSCTECSLKCVQGGIEILLDENIGLIEVCSKPYCYKISHPKRHQMIHFPKEVIITTYEVTVKLWSNGYLIKNLGKQCMSSPYCEMINCHFCWGLIGNPQCAPRWAFLVFFMMLYFFSFTIYMFIKLVQYGCWCCYYSTYFSWQCLRFCLIICRRARSKTYEKMYIPMYTIMRREMEENQNEESNLNIPEQTAIDMSSSRIFGYKPTTRQVTQGVVMSLSLICTQIGPVSTCAEVTTLTAQQSVCTIQAGGTLECVLTETTRLALVPQGQASCLLMKDPHGQPIGTLSIEVEKVVLECQMRNEYFTRSFRMKVESSKRCPASGSCSGEKCSSVKIDSKIEELNGEANNSPGFTYCAESCGCAACGCFYCTSGCLFYRTYAVPASDTTYEVFSCPAWNYKIKAKIRLNMQTENLEQEFELKPGVAVTWKNIKLTPTSVTSPPMPILGSRFLTDGTRTVMVQASASGQPVSGTIGEIQCSSREKAANFNCYLPHDSCICQGQETRASCNCAERILEDLFTKPEYVVPLTSQGWAVIGTGREIEAEYREMISLEIQVSMEGVRLSTKIEKNTCQIKPLEFSGCYNCLTGAKLLFECKTDFGEALAHVTCGMGAFSTTCTPQGVKSMAMMKFSNAVVKETCTVECPAGSTTFPLEATLVFIEKERLGNLSNVISAPNLKNEIDIGFLSGWLTGNWIAGLFLILMVIVVIIISIILFPIVFQLLIRFSVRISAILMSRMTKSKTKRQRELIKEL